VGPALEEEPDDVDAELKEEDEEDDEEEEDEEQKENDVQTTIQELQAAFGPYTPEAGWSILPTPASSQEAFDQMDLKKYFSADKKGAFLWDDGWDTGTYKSSMKAKGSYEHFFYYNTTKEQWSYELDLGTYGCGKSWVVLKRDKGKRKVEYTAT